jgi:hypothetical protein
VIRQFSVSAPVDRAVIDLLRTQPRMTISVSGVPHFGYSALAVQAEVVAQSQGDVAWEPDRVFVGLPDLPAYFPASERANLTIYAALDGIPGSDPGAWVIGPAGPWCRSAPGEFFTLPHEYRLAADTEHGVPAVNVLLLPPSDTVAGAPAAGMAAAGGAAASSYRVRVRVRFEVMPWWDPIQLAQLRTDIAETTATTYPELAIGGYASADFTPPSLLQHLGGDVLGAETSAIDANGFELVLDCSMEFYTLLCTLLAPPTGTPSGLEAHVRFTLTGGLEAPLTRDIPVRIRLDVLAGGFLPLTLVPNDTSPADPGAVDPGVQAKVRNMIGSTVDVEGAIATLLVAPGPGKPEGYPAAARAVPLPLRLGPAGGEADSAVLTLTPEAVVDPQAIAALDVQFTGIRLTDPPVSVLERVHELAASTSQPTSVRVTSYQLAHPDNLPASLADLYGIEVEVRIGTRPAVTAFLTRTEPDKTIGLALLIGDLVAGADPQQPSFEWRRRNLATSGTGEFSIWQTTSGRELFVTPTDPAT